MAVTKPYTWAYIKTLLQAFVEQNTDTPDTDDTSFWLVVGNRLIGDWEEEAEWDELWTYQNGGGTITANDTTYSLAADVREIGEHIELWRTDGSVEYVPFLDVTRVQRKDRLQEKFFYKTGVAGSYVLNASWTPQTGDENIGATIKFPYYKFASRLAVDADVVEMRDPNWLVDAIVGEVSNQPFKKQLFTARAQAKMNTMKSNNENAHDQSVDDDEVGFGV